jgi:hypothetical protein
VQPKGFHETNLHGDEGQKTAKQASHAKDANQERFSMVGIGRHGSSSLPL